MNNLYLIGTPQVKEDPKKFLILDNNVCSRATIHDVKKCTMYQRLSILPGLLELKKNFSYSEEDWTQQLKQLQETFPGADAYGTANGDILTYRLSQSLSKEFLKSITQLKLYRALAEKYSPKSMRTTKKHAIAYLNQVLDISENVLSFTEFMYLARLGNNSALIEALSRIMKRSDEDNQNSLMDLAYVGMIEQQPQTCLLTSDIGVSLLFDSLEKAKKIVSATGDRIQTSYGYDLWSLDTSIKEAVLNVLNERKIPLQDRLYVAEYETGPWLLRVCILRKFQHHSKNGPYVASQEYTIEKTIINQDLFDSNVALYSGMEFELKLSKDTPIKHLNDLLLSRK